MDDSIIPPTRTLHTFCRVNNNSANKKYSRSYITITSTTLLQHIWLLLVAVPLLLLLAPRLYAGSFLELSDPSLANAFTPNF